MVARCFLMILTLSLSPGSALNLGAQGAGGQPRTRAAHGRVRRAACGAPPLGRCPARSPPSAQAAGRASPRRIGACPGWPRRGASYFAWSSDSSRSSASFLSEAMALPRRPRRLPGAPPLLPGAACHGLSPAGAQRQLRTRRRKAPHARSRPARPFSPLSPLACRRAYRHLSLNLTDCGAARVLVYPGDVTRST